MASERGGMNQKRGVGWDVLLSLLRDCFKRQSLENRTIQFKAVMSVVARVGSRKMGHTFKVYMKEHK